MISYNEEQTFKNLCKRLQRKSVNILISQTLNIFVCMLPSVRTLHTVIYLSNPVTEESILNRNLSSFVKMRSRREMLKSKIASRRWIILDSFHITELNETPLQGKRTDGASIISRPEVDRILQLGEGASAVSSCR